jgi:hypothetical protein
MTDAASDAAAIDSDGGVLSDAHVEAASDVSAEVDSSADDSASDSDEVVVDSGLDSHDAGADTAEAFVLPDGAFTCTPAVTDDAAVGTRFCDLYLEIMAGDAPHKCQNHSCHGGGGAITTGPSLGWDGAGAYAGITSFKAPWITPPQIVQPVPGGDSRPVSSLLQVFAGSSLIARMPFDGPPYLTADQMSRVNAWLARGAPFD